LSRTREQKAKIINELVEKLNKAKIIVFTSFWGKSNKGLTAGDLMKIKKDLKDANAEYKVVKKTLMKLAVKNSGRPEVDIKNIVGSLGVIFGYDNEIEPIKIFYKFLKEKNEIFSLYWGILENGLIKSDQLIELATLPSKDILCVKMVSLLKSPLNNLVNILQANIRNLILILNQIKQTG